jgi:hypothetical protein
MLTSKVLSTAPQISWGYWSKGETSQSIKAVLEILTLSYTRWNVMLYHYYQGKDEWVFFLLYDFTFPRIKFPFSLKTILYVNEQGVRLTARDWFTNSKNCARKKCTNLMGCDLKCIFMQSWANSSYLSIWELIIF